MVARGWVAADGAGVDVDDGVSVGELGVVADRGLQVGEGGGHGARDVDRIGGGQLRDRDREGGLAVHARDAGDRCVVEGDLSHIAKANRDSAGRNRRRTGNDHAVRQSGRSTSAE